MAEGVGLTALHFIPLRPCGVRFAEGWKFRQREIGSQTRCLRQGFSARPQNANSPTREYRAGELAEGVGFEPTEPFGSPVFKTGAIDHSTTPPLGCFACRGELYRLAVGGVQGNSSCTVRSIDRVGDLAPQEKGTVVWKPRLQRERAF